MVKHSQSEVSPTSEQPSRGSEMITMPCNLQSTQTVPQCTGMWRKEGRMEEGEREGKGSRRGGVKRSRRGAGGSESVIPEDTRLHGNQIFHTCLFIG